MKENKENACPGCRRHCTVENVRCKYGRKFFAESSVEDTKKRHARHKWEKKLIPGGLIWCFLKTGRRIKKELRRKKISEEQLLNRLTTEEQFALLAILEKLNPRKKAVFKTVSNARGDGI